MAEPPKLFLLPPFGDLMTAVTDVFRGAPPSQLPRLVELTQQRQKDAHLYYQAIDSLPGVVVLLFDADYRYLYVGGGGVGFLGLIIDDLVGRRLHEVLSGNTYEIMKDHYDAALRGETRSFRLEGKGRVYFCDVGPVIENDTVAAGVLSARDVTGLV